MKIKWMMEDFICGYTLEKLEYNSTMWSSVKYGFKSVIRGVKDARHNEKY